MSTTPITDRPTATDHLLDARYLIVRVQHSTLPGTELWETLHLALCELDDGIALVRR